MFTPSQELQIAPDAEIPLQMPTYWIRHILKHPQSDFSDGIAHQVVGLDCLTMNGIMSAASRAASIVEMLFEDPSDVDEHDVCRRGAEVFHRVGRSFSENATDEQTDEQYVCFARIIPLVLQKLRERITYNAGRDLWAESALTAELVKDHRERDNLGACAAWIDISRISE